MRGNRGGAEELQEWRQIPPRTEKEEVTPEPPSRQLRGHEQGIVRPQTHSVQHARDPGIRRKESDIRHFHHLLIDRGNDRAVATIHDICEPVAVVLDERLVAIGERPLGSDQEDRDKQLRQGYEQAEKNRPARGCVWIHQFDRSAHHPRLRAIATRIHRAARLCRLNSHYFSKLDAGFHFRAVFDAAPGALFAESAAALSWHRSWEECRDDFRSGLLGSIPPNRGR